MRRIRRAAGRLGLDKNPLRRRSDRIETLIMATLLVVFLVGGPLLAMLAGRMTDDAGLREMRAQQSWHQVKAVVLKSAPHAAPAFVSVNSWWTRGRWTGPGGVTMTGEIPVPPGTQAGRTVPITINRSGHVVTSPLVPGELEMRVMLAEAGAVAGLVMVLITVGGAARLVLNRRRLESWDLEWSAVGPRWTQPR